VDASTRLRPAFPPTAGVAVAVLAVSFAAPLFRLANAPPVTASFWRLTFACILLLPFAWPHVKAWRAYSRRDWLVCAAAGVALGAHFALWVTSLNMTSVAASNTLVTLQAVFVALGGHFLLRDRLSPRNAWGVAIAVAGAFVIAAGGNPDAGRITGNLLALAAGLASAAYFLIGRRLRAHRSLIEYVLPVYAFAALSLLIALPFVRQPLWSAEEPLACLGLDSAGTFVAFVLLAAIPMLGGHTMANWAVRYLPAHTVATWILLEPVGAALLAFLIPCIAETPSAWTLAGGVLVLLGASLANPKKVAATEPAG
jgi:drug/metabolite transporter (DMT)-like permease